MEQNQLQQQAAELQAYEEQLNQVEKANLWSDIPMRQKAQIIREAVASGLTDLEQIRQIYTSKMLSNEVQPDQSYLEQEDIQGQPQQVEQPQEQQEQVTSFAYGGRVNKYEEGGGRVRASQRFYVDPAQYASGSMGQSSIQVQPLMSEQDIQYKRNLAVAAENQRQEQLKQQAMGTLKQGTMKSDGLTPEQRNQIMYQPKNLGERIKSGYMQEKIQYDNGKSPYNAIEMMGKMAVGVAAGGAIGAVSKAGKAGQVIKTSYDAYKTGSAAKGAIDAYQQGDTWGVASNVLGLASKAPVGKAVQTGAKVTSMAMKSVKKYGGRLKKKNLKC